MVLSCASNAPHSTFGSSKIDAAGNASERDVLGSPRLPLSVTPMALTLSDQIAEAQRQVDEGEARILHQREVIARLRNQGQDTALENQALERLQFVQRLYEDRLIRLLQQRTGERGSGR